MKLTVNIGEAKAERLALMRQALALRDSGAIKPVTREEIRAWRHESQKY